jgi:hypothetical protein
MGEILDAEKMKKCVWIRPELVAMVDFRSGRKRIAFGIPSSLRCAMMMIRTRARWLAKEA